MVPSSALPFWVMSTSAVADRPTRSAHLWATQGRGYGLLLGPYFPSDSAARRATMDQRGCLGNVQCDLGHRSLRPVGFRTAQGSGPAHHRLTGIARNGRRAFRNNDNAYKVSGVITSGQNIYAATRKFVRDTTRSMLLHKQVPADRAGGTAKRSCQNGNITIYRVLRNAFLSPGVDMIRQAEWLENPFAR